MIQITRVSLRRRYRVYSSGCMRISKPFQLLEALKPHLKSSDIAQIDRYRQTLKNKIMRLQNLYLYIQHTLLYLKRDGMGILLGKGYIWI